MKEFLGSEKIVPVTVIDGSYPLSKTAEAFWYFEKEHARGKVIITVGHQHELRLAAKFYDDRPCFDKQG